MFSHFHTFLATWQTWAATRGVLLSTVCLLGSRDLLSWQLKLGVASPKGVPLSGLKPTSLTWTRGYRSTRVPHSSSSIDAQSPGRLFLAIPQNPNLTHQENGQETDGCEQINFAALKNLHSSHIFSVDQWCGLLCSEHLHWHTKSAQQQDMKELIIILKRQILCLFAAHALLKSQYLIGFRI